MAVDKYENLNTYGNYSYGTEVPKRSYPKRPERNAETYDFPRHAQKVGFGYYVLLAFATVAICVSVVMCLQVHSEITSTKKETERLTKQLQTLTADNNASEVYLNKSVDLNEVYKVAVTELGMTYPEPGQIVYYNRLDAGYVRQYEDIPNS